jgi:hypothetical protein
MTGRAAARPVHHRPAALQKLATWAVLVGCPGQRRTARSMSAMPTRASAVGTRGEMACSMRRNGTAYWRALLMALWSLLNPTHPQ